MTERRIASYAAAREKLLALVLNALKADMRVAAAWLSGSLGRDEGDDWADYDLHVVVEDQELASFLSDRRALYAALGEVALVQDEIPGQPGVGDEFHLVHFASPFGPIEIDWSFITANDARRPIGHRLLFQRRAFPIVELPALSSEQRRALSRRWALFFWAMAPIAVRLCGRGDLSRAVGQIRLLERGLVCLWRLLGSQDGPQPWQPDANMPFESEYAARLLQLGQSLTIGQALDAVESLCYQAEDLQPSLEALSAAVEPLIISQTRELILTAREEIAAGRFPVRKYR